MNNNTNNTETKPATVFTVKVKATVKGGTRRIQQCLR